MEPSKRKTHLTWQWEIPISCRKQINTSSNTVQPFLAVFFWRVHHLVDAFKFQHKINPQIGSSFSQSRGWSFLRSKNQIVMYEYRVMSLHFFIPTIPPMAGQLEPSLKRNWRHRGLARWIVIKPPWKHHISTSTWKKKWENNISWNALSNKFRGWCSSKMCPVRICVWHVLGTCIKKVSTIMKPTNELEKNSAVANNFANWTSYTYRVP